ncbi:MAG TPA: DNA mismatch repair endonuclease MutL [Aggregatilinea sp.]|uniref:DNA mismatch repair endonuclease MutL n=1 Tax=Aggregatilinea sp. TaxID=2806333 RepID=UPI002CA2A040|nr:DNA mismatch repair endonuclease MutL [Aggregatilinea sp.]HML20196.1 DNA mismatch repair endonuclease MutL [Aggregatilinea sp.]
MSGSIQVLPDTVAAQIAAGEVVERPASAVKELVENALDAGATSITVEIEEGGKKLIRVSDDGQGIEQDELALAFARHATSKLRTVDDLNHILTLGFRGEALASIAAVSRTTIVSRARSEEIGATVQVEGGEMRYARQAGAPAGTVVTVENLFFNTPARLKFLKADSTERRHVMQLVTNYAMAYPNVRFRLIMEGREQFHSPGSGDVADVLVEVFGLETFKEMLEVSPQPPTRPDLPPIEVYGFTSTPNLNRSNRSQIILFVNGRAISDQSLTYAVSQAYHTLIPSGRYPMAVLMVTMQPEEVDVNVHPTKAEVRFRAPEAVFSAVQRAVRRAVVDQAPVPPIGGDPYQNVEEGWRPAPQNRPDPRPLRTMVPGEEQLRMELRSLDPGRFAHQRADYPMPTRPQPQPKPTEIPDSVGRPARPRTLPILRVIGQVGAMYIVAEGPAGLYLIDQHAAHERILYEQFMAQHAAMEPVAQRTLDAATVELSPSSAQRVEEALDLLAHLGFEIEPFGASTFRVRAIPALLADRDPGDVMKMIVQDLESGNEPGEVTLEEKLVRRVCKTAAVKAGQTLSYDEMQGLIRQLERCESPRTCPHGRPTMLHISGEELAKQFGRT